MAPSTEVVAAGSTALQKIDPDQTLKASKALLSHIKKAALEKSEDASSKKNVLGAEEDIDETPIWLNLTTKRHISSKAKLQPGKVALPHSLNADQSTTICLITADPQRHYKNIVAGDDFPEDLRKRVTRVIDFGKIKKKFSQYENQRKLFSEHDIFLADERIITRLPKVLGKTFYKTTAKRPIPVSLEGKGPKVDGKRKPVVKTPGTPNSGTPAQIAREIEKALGSALVSLSPTTNTAVRIGFAGWEPEQIADNVDAVVTKLVGQWVPQQWRNVRSIHIKGPESAALPIWLTDELWLDEKDVIANDSAPALQAAEKANVGKKRKSIGGSEEQDKTEEVAPKKKAKKQAPAPTAEADDDKLDKQISERKSNLRKQKAAAKKAMDE